MIAPNPNPPKSRDELVEGVQALARKIAGEYHALPGGLTHEDLVSEANVALCRRAAEWDPERGAWTTFAGWVIRGAVTAAIARERALKRGGGAVTGPLRVETADGEPLPLPADRTAPDPAAVAEARELVALPRKGRKGGLSVKALSEALPAPCEVAEQVTQLRAAMFGAIKADDVAAVMGAVVGAAKGGDLKAAKLLIDLLAPGRSGVTTVVNQQAVVLSPGDIG